MTNIPLALRLKKQAHKKVAEAQDIIVRELYNVFDNAVLHGGTAIWRCYQGNRFSEDVDAYLPKDESKIKRFFENLEKIGFEITKKKHTENTLYSKLDFNGSIVRFEALFKTADGIIREYETSDGNILMVYTLTSEDFVKEKTAAYLNRLKIRDLYDIFHLLKHVKNKKEVLNPLKQLLKNFKKPVDEEDLKVLMTEGLAPTSAKMLDYMRRWSHG